VKTQRVPLKPAAGSRRSWTHWGFAIPGSSHRRQAFIQLGRDVLISTSSSALALLAELLLLILRYIDLTT